MRYLVYLLFLAITLSPCGSDGDTSTETESPIMNTRIVSNAEDRPRLAILTDIGGDPDDQQSMVRLMVYSREFEIEALIASASGNPDELDVSTVRPDLIRQIIRAYQEVLPNLQRHAKGWPSPAHLLSAVKSGNPHRKNDFIGEGHDTEASRFLIERIDSGSEHRPLNICIWGGQTDLAQALWRVKKDRGVHELADLVKKFRVHDIDDQDGIASWMRAEFPGMYYILDKAHDGQDKRMGVYRGMYLTGDESFTSREWVEQNIHGTGPLGALYPSTTWTAPNRHSCVKEGDTPSWFFFLPMGGNDPNDPSKPGWGGQFEKGRGGWYFDPPATETYDPRTGVSRWRQAFQEDFALRMGWSRDE